jgi:hypothetical protein
VEQYTLANFLFILEGCIATAIAIVLVTNRESWGPIVLLFMSRTAAAARRAAGMDLVSIPVFRYGMDAGGMDDAPERAPDIDAANIDMRPFRRDLTDSEWIVWMAVARGKDRKYRFSANAIHAAIGGDRNAVLATIKELRAVPPPALFRQDDGSTAPAAYPVTR